MAYHVYQTRGFIIRTMNIGEADRMVFVFTESLGLVGVSARGARKTTSKLRYSLQNYSFVRIALVRGKNVWRLTDAEEIESFRAPGDVSKLKLVARIFSFVNRFVHGEGENSLLFKTLEDIFGFLRREDLSEDEIFLTEMIAACRLLSALGYMGENKDLAQFVREPISKLLLVDFVPHRGNMVGEINRALRESQL